MCGTDVCLNIDFSEHNYEVYQVLTVNVSTTIPSAFHTIWQAEEELSPGVQFLNGCRNVKSESTCCSRR